MLRMIGLSILLAVTLESAPFVALDTVHQAYS